MYLIVNRVFCFVGEKDRVKYLKIDKGAKSLEDSVLLLSNNVFTGIKHFIKKINHEWKLLDECKDFQTVKNLVKLNFMLTILI